MTSVIIGATAGVGRALAYQLAESGRDLIIASSDRRDLEALARDIELNFKRNVTWVELKIGRDPEWFKQFETSVNSVSVNELFVPMGASQENDTVDLDPRKIANLYEINLVSVTQIVSALIPKFKEKKGVIVGFGSIASARGRSKNVHYASAKSALKTYFESLSHALAKTDIRVHWYQLGYVDTQQSAGQKLLFPAAKPDEVARKVIRNLNRGNRSFIYPYFWRWILFILRRLPWTIFKRLQF